MKPTLSLVLVATVLAGSVAEPAGPLIAAESSPPAKAKSGTTLQNADIARVAKTWERLIGGTATVSERAQGRKVSLTLSATSKDELRKAFVAALRENGISVTEREGGVLFDAEPKAP
jgi:hypothetical protein